MTDDKPTVTELIAKLTENQAQLADYEIKVKDFEKTVGEKDTLIAEKDAEISKLQSILAKNFIASRDNPKSDIKQTSFADAYAKAIKDNTKE